MLPLPLSMLHHISLGAVDMERAARFYDAVLEPLGYVRVWSDLRPGEEGQAVGYGSAGSGDKLAIKQVSQPIPRIPGFHVALAAPSRESVAAFHAAALAAGGIDNGRPGLRPDYGPDYFAAFIADPEGHRLEAVCDAPESSGSDAAPATDHRYARGTEEAIAQPDPSDILRPSSPGARRPRTAPKPSRRKRSVRISFGWAMGTGSPSWPAIMPHSAMRAEP